MGGSASYRLARKIANARDRGAPQSEIDELERRRQEALETERQKRQAAKQPPTKSFRDKLNEVQTRDELKSVLYEKYSPERFDDKFLKKNVNMLKRVMNTLDELEDRYPEMKGKVQAFKSYTGKAQGKMSLFGDLTLNAKWNKEDDPELYDDFNGWHPKNTTPEAIVAHEFAHAIQARILEKYYPDAFINGRLNPMTPIMDRLNLGGDWNTGQYLRPIQERAMARLGYTSFRGASVVQATSQISRYATKNIFEAFSEAFADVYSNGDNASEASKAFTEEMIAELRR